MANLQYTSDIKHDVLFRAGEKTDGTSNYDARALEYINRAQRAIAMGGSEFAPDIQEEWWWLRKDPPGTLVLQPPYEVGTVIVTNDNATITFSSPPTFSAADYFFRTDTDVDLFRISTHTAAAATATLDTVFTGTTGAAKRYKLFKLEYALASDVLRVMAPMRGFTNGPFEVDGCELAALERDYPLGAVEKGRPTRFAHITESKVRFNRYGIDTGGSLIRLEYDYIQQPSDLTNSLNEESLIPREYRYLMSDMALFWLYLVKDDNRAPGMAESAQRGLAAMQQEHRHRMVTYSRMVGRISPRPTNTGERGPMRTESGVIIG